MNIEEIVAVVGNFCAHILPILGVILLVYLIILMRRLLTFLAQLGKTVETTNKLVETANDQVRKLDGPLNSLNEISNSIDYVHHLSQEAIQTIALFILENLNALKDWILSMIEKFKKTPEETAMPTSEIIKNEPADAE